jgi:acyl-CoA thioester hydrolase
MMAMKGERWPELAGRIEEQTHVLPIRVYFEDTDFTGLVYHANFLKFCERGRSDFIRLLGINHRSLANPAEVEPAVFVVRRIEIDYLKPARIDEVLEVVTRCVEVGGASLKLDQEVRKDGSVSSLSSSRPQASPRGSGTSLAMRFNDSLTKALPSWVWSKRADPQREGDGELQG